ncbi:hypothetical protein ATO00_07600 [Loigolactobacillus coryniformis subsp. coryniformis]|uniref:Uncharacterized protein n=1 Tax=Loigolactobacillus coryniformis subsp. coryniformis KCTC 3167 = DSM 20001 TaxID=913848 RepID=A0A0R1F276_9LACO|nr:hypothetical protein FD22_GL001442 [Loigolactobacillus coryniformis subsp. coryniformis KCTC 3167 = DSM 20001]OEH89976.1 hypothetical protein ATO00_07600 [Loigolactobacillus coryniformis subsp. coryniformis]
MGKQQNIATYQAKLARSVFLTSINFRWSLLIFLQRRRRLMQQQYYFIIIMMFSQRSRLRYGGLIRGR